MINIKIQNKTGKKVQEISHFGNKENNFFHWKKKFLKASFFLHFLFSFLYAIIKTNVM